MQLAQGPGGPEPAHVISLVFISAVKSSLRNAPGQRTLRALQASQDLWVRPRAPAGLGEALSLMFGFEKKKYAI